LNGQLYRAGGYEDEGKIFCLDFQKEIPALSNTLKIEAAGCSETSITAYRAA
jgi:hypothetical protein